MKTLMEIVLSKKAKLFKLIFLSLLFTVQKSMGQFESPGTLPTTVSPAPITINTVKVGQGATPGVRNIAIGNAGTLSGASTGINNTAVGVDALTTLNTGTANESNTALGVASLQFLTTGGSNTAIGVTALQNFISGNNNTAVGVFALQGATNISTGSSNTALGAQALRAVTSGSSNCGIGGSALAHVTGGAFPAGWRNVGVGDNAGSGITTGEGNVILGVNSGLTVTTGSNNIVIGRSADVMNPTSSNQLSIQNIIYGVGNAGVNTTISTGSIGIGVIPVAYSGANFARLIVQGDIGNAPSLQLLGVPSTTTNPTGTYLYADAMGVVRKTNLPASGITASCGTANFLTMNGSTANTITCSQITDNGITGTVQIGTNTVGNVDFTGAGTYVQYYNSGQVNQSGTSQIPVNTHYKLFVQGWTASTGFIALSDKRLKKNIKKLESPLSKIAQLNGYSYDWNKENFAGKKLDDSRQAGLLAQEVEKVLPEAVVKNSDGVYGLNYNAIVPLLTEGIKEQQTEIEDLKSEIKELKNKLNQLVPGETKLKVNTIEVVPNPITGVSIVSYKLDNNNAPSGLVIYDLQGKLLKQISLPKNVKEGQVQVTKNDLPAGMYIFALVSGNLEIQSKKVLVSE